MTRRNLRFWAATIALSTLIGACMAAALRGLPVEICVDVEPPYAGGVLAVWAGGVVVLEEIEEAYAPSHFLVELESPVEASGKQSDGYQMIAMLPPDSVHYEPRDAWAEIHTYFFLHGAARPARLSLAGWGIGPGAYLSFETDPYSGTVQVRGGSNPPDALDLQSAGRGKKVYGLAPDARLQRYYGRVPRQSLRGLRIAGDGSGPIHVRRQVVNSLVPRTYVRAGAPGHAPCGFVEQNWEPATPGGGGVLLPREFYLGAGWLPAFIVFTLAGLAAMWIAVWPWRVLVRILENRYLGASRDWLQGAFAWKTACGLWAATFLVWFTFLLAFYPGTMNADSLTQWKQAMTFAFEPDHPPFYAWIMWVMRHIWDSPFSTALPQVVLGSALVAFAASLLWRAGVNRAVVLAMYLIGTLSPRNMTMMIALIKDAPYGICMFGAALSLAWILLRRNRRNWLPWATLGLCLGLAALFRQNGPMMVAGTLPFLILFFLRQWRGLALCFLLAFAVFFGAKGAVIARIPMAPTNGGLHDLMTAHLAILLDRDVPLRNEEYAFLAQVRDLEDRWAYEERRADATTIPFLDGIYHREWAKEHRRTYRDCYTRLVLRNPLTAARYFWDRGAFLLVPWPTDTPMETYFLGIPQNRLGLYSMDFFLKLPDQLRAVLAWTATDSLSWLFWRPALPLYLVLIAGLALCLRMRDPIWAVVYLPFAINTGIVGLAAVSHACRYQFPLTFAAAFLVALAFLPKAVPCAYK